MTTLFIADLHLDPSRPAVTRAFLQLLEQQASSADALYILGDLFEVWLGDDDSTPLSQSVIAGLQQLTASGTPVYLMHGNRDFLLGEDFCHQSGCQLIADPSVIDCYGHRVLLMHGDALCTDDAAYMAFRAQCRTNTWQTEILSRPLEQRRALAQQMRAESKQANSNKPADIMDVNPDEVVKALRENQVSLLIHGHTHRPAVHDIQIGNDSGQRVVLGDWDESGWLLRYDHDHRYQLECFSCH
jgi:UDP-2,3-diacylglucosamine hydrolase